MTPLSNDEKLFWSNLLIYVEEEVKPNSNGFNITNKSLTQFCRQNNIVLVSQKGSKQLPALSQTDKNTIRFKYSNKACATLLKHLRNAFAHCNINKDAKGNYELQDKYNSSLTMTGRIEPNLLYKLVEQIKAIRHK